MSVRTVLAALVLAASVAGPGSLPSSATADEVAVDVAPSRAAQSDDERAGFVGLRPHRVLDTRIGTGAPTGPVGPGAAIDVVMTGVGGVPAGGVDTVVVNVAVTAPTAQSFVTVWPTGVERPTAASLNMVAGQTFANLVFAKVGTGGSVSLYNDSGSTHLVGDIVGYFPVDSGYTGVTPTRVLDTRTDPGPNGGRRGPGSITLVDTTGAGGIPDDGTVRAAVVNVTAVNASEPSFVTAFEFGLEKPLAANLTMAAGQTIPNLIVQRVDRETGQLWLWNESGTTDLVADVVGYFTVDANFYGTLPTRVLDTREGVGAPAGVVGPGETITLDLSSVGNLVDGPGSVALNVTVVAPSGDGFLTVWPGGQRPLTAVLNFPVGGNIPNLVVSDVGDDRTISIYNSSGESHIVADLFGWFADTEPPPGGGCHVRNALESMDLLSSSEHFAAFWGGEADDRARLDLAIERTLGDMELAWDNGVGELGMPRAPGTPLLCANVYIGQTGGVFDDAGPGVGTDVDGFPQLVMPLSVVEGFADEAPGANVPGVEYTQHEVFHLFQYDSPFDYVPEKVAWIEGTADWFTRYTYPTDQGGRYPVAAYLRYPHDALWTDGDSVPQDGDLNDTRGAHAYGTSWFFYYLTGYLDLDASVIADGFTGSERDPWVYLRDALASRSVDMGRVFGDFAARNATLDWDAVDIAGIADGHNYWDIFDSPDYRIAAEHPGGGTGGVVRAPAATTPMAFAWNTVRLTSDRNGTYEITVDGDELGSEGDASEFEVHVVVRSGSNRTYERLALDDSNAASTSVAVAVGDEISLVVAPVTPVTGRLGGNQTYGYEYSITPS